MSNHGSVKNGFRHDARREELAGLLSGLADADVAQFDDQMGPDTAYCRNLIHRDLFHEVAGARWAAGRSCVLHGHSESAVLLHVLSGKLVEERYLRNRDRTYRYETSVLMAGSSSYLPVGTFHRLRCEEQAATVHAFAPIPANPVTPVPPHLVDELKFARQQSAWRRAVVEAGHGLPAKYGTHCTHL